MKRKNILVTGGAGFIGSHIADKLIALGHKVTVFDNLSTGEKRFINPKAKFLLGDVARKKDVEKAFQDHFDVVFHIAGCASSIQSFMDPDKDIQTNFLGTVNITLQCIKSFVPRLLYASSMTVYGKTGKLPISETTHCFPVSYYGISKFAAERFVHASSERVDLKNPLNVTSFRMYNVYGPRQSLTNPYQGVMAIFIGNVLRNEPVTIFGDGKQSRDFIYIDDVVDVWIKSMDIKETSGHAYNLGFGKDISINVLVSDIIKTLKKNPKDYLIHHKPPRPGDQRHMQADISKIKKVLSWEPKTNLAQGLKNTIAWAVEQK